MYVYIESEPGLWTVGFYRPDGKWNPESDHDSKDEAANRVAYLNGGNKGNHNGITLVAATNYRCKKCNTEFQELNDGTRSWSSKCFCGENKK